MWDANIMNLNIIYRSPFPMAMLKMQSGKLKGEFYDASKMFSVSFYFHSVSMRSFLLNSSTFST